MKILKFNELNESNSDNIPEIHLMSGEDLYGNMDGSYKEYKKIKIYLKLRGKIISWSYILLDVKIKDFLNKDGSEIKEIKSNYLNEKSIYISRIGTYDDHKNKGYATKIIQKIYDICIENKCEFITLDSMPNSLDFWIKKGFEVYNEVYHKGENEIKYYNMVKVLH